MALDALILFWTFLEAMRDIEVGGSKLVRCPGDSRSVTDHQRPGKVTADTIHFRISVEVSQNSEPLLCPSSASVLVTGPEKARSV